MNLRLGTEVKLILILKNIVRETTSRNSNKSITSLFHIYYLSVNDLAQIENSLFLLNEDNDNIAYKNMFKLIRMN